MQVFGRSLSGIRPTLISDGLSNTIALGEHYATCQRIRFSTFDKYEDAAVFARAGEQVGMVSTQLFMYYPERWGNPPETLGFCMGGPDNLRPTTATFQTRPKPNECWPGLAQTPFAGGMVVGMMDGSVRTIRPDVAPAVFCAAVTPDWGDGPTPDW